jgi:hypothetical protein
MRTESADLVLANLLLDHLKVLGFEFHRAGSGEDGPLVGERVSDEWIDLIHIEGFSRDCFAWRKRISSLIVPGDALVERRAHGPAITLLNDVLTWKADRQVSDELWIYWDDGSGAAVGAEAPQGAFRVADGEPT